MRDDNVGGLILRWTCLYIYLASGGLAFESLGVLGRLLF